MTIEETLLYFGRLHKMSRSQVQDRIEFLLQFLHLPEKTRLISKLRYNKSLSLFVLYFNLLINRAYVDLNYFQRRTAATHQLCDRTSSGASASHSGRTDGRCRPAPAAEVRQSTPTHGLLLVLFRYFSVFGSTCWSWRERVRSRSSSQRTTSKRPDRRTL